MRGHNASRAPSGGAARRLWATRASDCGSVHWGVSPVEAYDAGHDGGPVWAPSESGDDCQSGAGDVAAVAAPVAAAQTYVRTQSIAHLDETGWREGRTRVWLWVAVTAWVTVFVVRLSRGTKVAEELLGERFCGILVTDRWSAYTWYLTRWRQICWAHLLRDFEAMIERGGQCRGLARACGSRPTRCSTRGIASAMAV